MKYDFDEIIERKNTDSLKYDFAVKRGKPEDILPFWVADMDFKSPPCIIDALLDRSGHGIFGYSDTREDYSQILQDWFFRNFNWKTESAWLVKAPGVVYAICTAIRGLTEKGEAVMIQEPVYYPFRGSVTVNERKLVVNELVYQDGKYIIDFEDFEKKITENGVKMFVLCSPHNPVGRVWTEDELIRMGDICIRHNVIVVSDEIHEDFIYPGHRHRVFAALKPEFNNITVTCTAPTKTFNLAGLQISNVYIANRNIRHRFQKEIARSGYSQPNIMGVLACKAAYEHGDEWLAEIKGYLNENLDFTKKFLREKLPGIRIIEPEGTFLVWLDCKELGLDDKQLDDLIVHKAGLWLDAGPMFGMGGEGFQRINIACPKAELERALTLLAEAVKSIK